MKALTPEEKRVRATVRRIRSAEKKARQANAFLAALNRYYITHAERGDDYAQRVLEALK
jgi:hypothetical protein